MIEVLHRKGSNQYQKKVTIKAEFCPIHPDTLLVTKWTGDAFPMPKKVCSKCLDHKSKEGTHE